MSNSSVYPTPLNTFKQSKRSVLSVIVDNEPGILANIPGSLSTITDKTLLLDCLKVFRGVGYTEELDIIM